jgi:hypothetical protein
MAFKLPVLKELTCYRRSWWRRRELNPRPRKPAMQSLRVYPVLACLTATYKTGKSDSRLVRLISAHSSGPKLGTYPAK